MEGPGLQVRHALLLILGVKAVAAHVLAYFEVEPHQPRAREKAVPGLEKIVEYGRQHDDYDPAVPRRHTADGKWLASKDKQQNDTQQYDCADKNFP